MVRGLAVQEFKPRDFWKILWKEMRVAIITGILVAAVSCIWFMLEMYLGIISFGGEELNEGIALAGADLFFARFKIASLVSVTLFFGIMVAKFVGVALPMLVAALKKDPALISSPFVTTVVDVCSLLIYMGFALMVIPSLQL